MRIIENYEEAAELRDDILRAMENAYVAIFKK
jgi:protein-arginine kinase activator protein McsA